GDIGTPRGADGVAGDCRPALSFSPDGETSGGLTPPVERAPRGPFADAVASLSDRALRRLLGARAYLRGCDYVRRRAVGDIVVDDGGARAIVRGTAQTPYEVRVSLAPNGISSQCNCPA